MATASTTATDVKPLRDDVSSVGSGILAALGSLKLTVTLFAFSLIIVLVGTLAQDEMNMFDVKQRYFTSWIAWMHLDDWFPQAFFPHKEPIFGVIPIPGGAAIGLMLMLNLVAAKITRFRVKADGGKLAMGLGFLVGGLLLAGLIIASGNNNDGLQGNPPEWLSYQLLWRGCQLALFAITVASVVSLIRTEHKLAHYTLGALAMICGGYLVFTIVNDFIISDSGLRIVWQLTKGLGAGVVLLIGCLLLFDKQAGNMLLHIGVGLLMVGQFVFGDRQLEQRLSLVEGESSNTLVNLDKVELTFIQSVGDEDTIVAIPGSRLLQVSNTDNKISDPSLPVDVVVHQYFENSKLIDTDSKNPATTGMGTEVQAKEMRKNGGVDSEVNLAAAYVELFDKDSEESLGTHLVSQSISDRVILLPGQKSVDRFDEVAIGENTYKLGLRYHREVKPYWVQLKDVRRENYSGTETPRDYTSEIRIFDPATGEDRHERVWMNNPLRYRGETFFQSSYTALPSGKELTGLQVVQNSGWMIPYVACSITALGMLVHFLTTLGRFTNRREREIRRELTANPGLSRFQSNPGAVAIGAVCLCLAGVGLLQPWKALTYGRVDAATAVVTESDEFDFASAGAIPVQFGGRVMPLDAYARQAVKAMTNKESLPADRIATDIRERMGEDAKKLSALQWLFEVAIDEPQIRSVPMFRIDADPVRAELDVERRESKLYSLIELSDNWDRIGKLLADASDKEKEERTFKDRKAIELDLRTRNYTMAAAAFQLPIPDTFEPEDLPEGITLEQANLFAMRQLEGKLDALETMVAPNLIPPSEAVARDAVNDPKWSAFGSAFFKDFKQRALESTQEDLNDADLGLGSSGPNSRPGISTFTAMLKAYGENDKSKFNAAVQDHLAAVQAYPIPGYSPGRVSLERWMNSKFPTTVAMIFYGLLLVLSLVCLLFNVPALRSAVWGMLLVTFLIHTGAIACRIAITNRAPVINIYSSAVFIGWAAAGFGLIIEALFRRSIGNTLSSSVGLLTLLVAYGLSINTGDTMPVLQAVLDTQFWLTTHVIGVSLGYVATLVAGCFGIFFLVANWLGADKKFQQELYRCCYGTACFGILFSFVGTLLGGLWADDSWGRFWGWDPKENGALLIVIWNALMLHARWDGMVKARGFSILAIGGNIITAWSWFGTNELGIGLHSYGFTSGVLMWLSIFVFSQLAFIAAGLVFYRKPPEAV